MTNKKSKNGGKVLASGGFGCVFSPALRCNNSKTRKQNNVSKVMTEKHAVEEYDEITEIKNKLDSIKNYDKYFLVDDITMCKPAELTESDLINFKQKCSALPKDNITYKNINSSLDNIMVLNMPNGGIPVDDYINSLDKFDELYKLNNSLMNLLKNGIIPMNNKNVYHCDIKDSNVLVDESNNTLQTRLIDWGLSTTYIPFKDYPFPSTWKNRPLQYNVPFSVIIFTDAFVEKYTNYLNKNGEIDEDSLYPFVLDYIQFWLKERGPGHYKLIEQIIGILTNKKYTNLDEEPDSSGYTNSFIADYIVEILLNFTTLKNDGTFNIREYLDNVFINIVDIWGFISIYLPLLEMLHENYDNLSKSLNELFFIIKDLFIILYSPTTTPIDKTSLFDNLQKINNLLKPTKMYGNKNIGQTQLNLTKSSNTSKGITGETFVPDDNNKNGGKKNTTRKKRNNKNKNNKNNKNKKYIL